jgi:cytochrome c oxidase subunit II
MPVIQRLATITAAVLAAGAAGAQEALNSLPILGRPTDGALGFQAPATDHMADVIWLDNFLLVIITAISVFVMALLLIVILRYNRRANPTPATFTHNSPLEVAWTFIPIVILVVIGAFSLPVLFQDQEIPEGDIHIKATGFQWYWSYEYTDEGVSFDSFMIGQGENVPSPDTLEELAAQGYGPDEFRLATDTAMVVPVGATVVLTVTAADVIHSWTVPAFGVKQDGVPGRLAQLWFRAETEGVFFGQCSELCGKDHAYMPITVKVVSPEVYQEWLVANGATPDEPAT